MAKKTDTKKAENPAYRKGKQRSSSLGDMQSHKRLARNGRYMPANAIDPDDAVALFRKLRSDKQKGTRQAYDPSFGEIVIRTLAEGGSLTSCCAALGVTWQTFQEWRTHKVPETGEYIHPEFVEAIEIGLKMSEQWWVDAGQENLHHPTFNSHLYNLNMMNRFGWGEKKISELSGPDGGPVQFENFASIMKEALDDDGELPSE